MAYRRPQQIAGMVYVDVTHERINEVLPQAAQVQQLARVLDALAVLGEVGLWRLLDRAGMSYPQYLVRTTGSQWPPGFPLREAELLYGRRATMRAVAAEYASIPTCIAEIAQHRRRATLPDVTTVVLSSSGGAAVPAEVHARYVEECHGDLAAQSSDSRHEVVEGAGHMIMLDRPDRVVAAIQEVVDKATSVSPSDGD